MESKLRYCEALVAWSPPDWGNNTAGRIAIGPLIGEGERDWSWAFACTGGAAWFFVRALKGKKVLQALLSEKRDIVRVWKLDPAVVHQEFMRIEEYAVLHH